MKIHIPSALVVALAAAITAILAVPAQAVPGDLDITFSFDGKQTTDFFQDDTATGIAIQPDGKIVIGGHSGDGTSNDDFVMARYNSNGSLDTTFGVNGFQAKGFGAEDQAHAMVLQPDGKIILAGSTNNSGTNDFALLRCNANGSFDTTFGTNGIVTTPIGGGDDRCTSVALQKDGKIVVAGSAHNGSNTDFAVARYNPDGTLDTSFSTDGKQTTDFLAGNDVAQAVAVQPDGKIVVAGSAKNGGLYEFAVARYNADGSPDLGFSSDGRQTTIFSNGDDFGHSVALQKDGKIVVAGAAHSDVNGSDLAVVRYNPDGSLDNGFSGDGKVITTIGDYTDGAAVAVQYDGKIVIAGSAAIPSNVAVARFNPDGSLDSGFSGDGQQKTKIGTGNDIGTAMALQADGKIVVAGESYNGSNSDFALVRYNARIQGDTRVGTNAAAPRGNDIYNLTGTGQVQPLAIRRGGGKKSAFVRIQNDGNEADSFRVAGTKGNRKFRVKYLNGSANVTSQVQRGTFDTGVLAPGGSLLLEVKVTAKTPRKRKQLTISIITTSAADPTASDIAVIKAKSR